VILFLNQSCPKYNLCINYLTISLKYTLKTVVLQNRLSIHFCKPILAKRFNSMIVINFEVHISNTFSREDFRHKSYISPNAKGIIIGFGLQSYELALQSFLK